jgi:DNA-binding transcriptional MerR regulator
VTTSLVAELRIGDLARRFSATTRTLRYYQEVGLLEPTGVSPGGVRLYSEADAERLARIVELRDTLGFDLERIRLVLQSEDRLNQLREEAAHHPTPERRGEMVVEAYQLNMRIQREIDVKLRQLAAFRADLQEKVERYRLTAAEVGVDLDAVDLDVADLDA